MLPYTFGKNVSEKFFFLENYKAEISQDQISKWPPYSYT